MEKQVVPPRPGKKTEQATQLAGIPLLSPLG